MEINRHRTIDAFIKILTLSELNLNLYYFNIVIRGNLLLLNYVLYER